MATRQKSFQPYMHENGQFTVEVPGVEKKDGETIPRRHPAAKNGLITTPDPDVRTVYDLVRRGGRLFGNAKALGWRKTIKTHTETKMVKKTVDGQTKEVEKKWTYFELSEYSYMSFSQYEKLVEQLSSGLRKVGLQKGDRLHLYAGTRYVNISNDFVDPMPNAATTAHSGSPCPMPLDSKPCLLPQHMTHSVWKVCAILSYRQRRLQCFATRRC